LYPRIGTSLILVSISPPVTLVASVKDANASASSPAVAVLVALVAAAFFRDSVGSVKSQQTPGPNERYSRRPVTHPILYEILIWEITAKGFSLVLTMMKTKLMILVLMALAA